MRREGESSGQRSTDGFVCTTYSVDIWRKRVSEKLCEGLEKKEKKRKKMGQHH